MFRILAFVIVSAVLFAEGPQSADTKKTTAPAKKSAPPPAGIPKNAVESEPGIWKVTDEKGETWFYRPTPFGFSKYKDGEKTDDNSEDARLIRAIDEGENVRFERSTPFGQKVWTRKKSELKGVELEAWQVATGLKPAKPAPAASSPSKGTQK